MGRGSRNVVKPTVTVYGNINTFPTLKRIQVDDFEDPYLR